MREALAARSDDDFVTSPPPVRRAAPARRPASPRRAAPAKTRQEPGPAAKLLGFVLQRPREAFVTLLLTGCAAAIAWNALALQTVRHPAPLFMRPSGHAAESASPTPTLLPPARPTVEAPASELPSSHAAMPAPAVPVKPSRSAIADLIAKGEVTQPQRVIAAPPPPPAAPAPLRAQPQPAQDSIAEMIRMGGPVPVPPAAVGKPEADAVLLGQRALAKLGYGVKPDGIMGSETRQAIERFERDRRLPVTGEFGSRTLRELASLSGLPMP